MFQKLTISLVFIFGVFQTVNKPLCTCVFNYQKAFKHYTTVFSAKITSVKDATNQNYNKEAILEIIKTYKGEPETIILSTIKGCSTPLLKPNKEWLFFTSKENGIQVLESCNPSIKLSPNKYELKNSDKLKKWQQKTDKNIKLIDSLSLL
ncbi:hypothetical protein [Winogradskyella endarachnes]|uniref:Uncharacterized protein n=1 Tax=Winogradskyella endarachnes TaxID=2681965 RepID=A0A6L6U4J5_9FLAO|nr:hypothetical protein [Winogradskyella endarachnes]MUU76888.1 hypothetical protein [Winogradskyella endarachnes]